MKKSECFECHKFITKYFRVIIHFKLCSKQTNSFQNEKRTMINDIKRRIISKTRHDSSRTFYLMFEHSKLFIYKTTLSFFRWIRRRLQRKKKLYFAFVQDQTIFCDFRIESYITMIQLFHVFSFSKFSFFHFFYLQHINTSFLFFFSRFFFLQSRERKSSSFYRNRRHCSRHAQLTRQFSHRQRQRLFRAHR